MSDTTSPVIGVLLGDAAGVGPELVAKIIAEGFLTDICRPVVIGDRRVLERGQKQGNASFPVASVDSPRDADWSTGAQIIDMRDLDPSAVPVGQVSVDSGKAVGAAILKAVDLCKKGEDLAQESRV